MTQASDMIEVDPDPRLIVEQGMAARAFYTESRTILLVP